MASNKSVVSVVVALVIAAPLTGCSLNFQHLPLGRGLPGESYPLNMEFVDASLLPVGHEFVRTGQTVRPVAGEARPAS